MCRASSGSRAGQRCTPSGVRVGQWCAPSEVRGCTAAGSPGVSCIRLMALTATVTVNTWVPGEPAAPLAPLNHAAVSPPCAQFSKATSNTSSCALQQFLTACQNCLASQSTGNAVSLASHLAVGQLQLAWRAHGREGRRWSRRTHRGIGHRGVGRRVGCCGCRHVPG